MLLCMYSVASVYLFKMWEAGKRYHSDVTHQIVLIQKRKKTMLRYSIIFFVIAIIAGIFGFGGIAGSAAGIAKILFIGFLILAVLSLIFGRKR